MLSHRRITVVVCTALALMALGACGSSESSSRSSTRPSGSRNNASPASGSQGQGANAPGSQAGRSTPSQPPAVQNREVEMLDTLPTAEQKPTPVPTEAAPDEPRADGMPAWWHEDVRREDGRIFACAEGRGASLADARRMAVDDARERLREHLSQPPQQDRIGHTSARLLDDGTVLVYVLISAPEAQQ